MADVRKRKPITERMKIDALLWHFDITCHLCGQMIHPNQDIQWDHIWALALGGPHDISNIVPVCYACHRKKTFGTKATSAGSDIHKIAKCKRIARTRKMLVNHKWDTKSYVIVTPKPKRKLRSRGFQPKPEGYKHNWRTP